jgi:hypothetical protein
MGVTILTCGICNENLHEECGGYIVNCRQCHEENWVCDYCMNRDCIFRDYEAKEKPIELCTFCKINEEKERSKNEIFEFIDKIILNKNSKSELKKLIQCFLNRFTK